MTKHQTFDRLIEEATIKPLAETFQRLPETTEAQIRDIVREEIEPLRALLQELVDEKRAREKATAEKEAATQLAWEEMNRHQAEMRALAQEQMAGMLDCTPPGGRSSMFNRIGRHNP
jgi:hypothetical protein